MLSRAHEPAAEQRGVDDVALAARLDGHPPGGLLGVLAAAGDAPRSSSGEGIRVVVLDSGVEWSLPVFRGAIIRARDFTGSGLLSDPTGHGTGNASVLVGQGHGTVIGLTPACELLVGKVLSRTDRRRTERAVVSGIGWAVAEQADVLVLPFGTRRASAMIRAALERALEAGCWVFAAAGNRPGEGVSFPAWLPGVQAVSVLGSDGQPDAAYCTADDVNLFASGRDIPAVGPDGPTALSGSSVAAVVAAGLTARDRTAVQVGHAEEGYRAVRR